MTAFESVFWVLGGLALLIFSGALVACEFALVKLRYDPVEADELEELRAHTLIRLIIDRSEHAARVIRFSKTGCTIGFGVLFAVVLWRMGYFEPARGAAPGPIFLILLALGLALLFHYVLVELLPRALALRSPQRTLRTTYVIVLLFELVTWPLMALLRLAKSRIYSVIGLNVEDDLNPLDVEVQIRAMGVNTPHVSKVVRSIINRALQMQELSVADVLLPRNQVMIFDLEDTIEENLELARKCGHTRYPLCEGDLDHCHGIIHIKDIFRYRWNVATLDLKRMSRPIVRFEENEPLERVLQSMLRYKVHMSLVQDEFGGVVGVVTLERILEVLVGEIQDEFDAEETPIVRLGAGRYRVSGLTPIHDLEKELELDIGPLDVATVSGMIISELGRIPAERERVSIGPLEFLIREVDETRILSAQVSVQESTDRAGD